MEYLRQSAKRVFFICTRLSEVFLFSLVFFVLCSLTQRVRQVWAIKV